MKLRVLRWVVACASSMLLACSSTGRVSRGTEGSDSGVDSAAGTGNGSGTSGGRGGSPVPDAALGLGSGGGSGYSGASGDSGVSAAGGAGPAGSTGVGASDGMVGAAGTTGSAGSAGTSGTAGSGGASGSAGSAGTAGCPASLAGPRLVAVGGVCIDSTEVTNAHYAQFLAANGGDTSGQNAVCSLNQTYEPSAYWPAPTSEAGLPVVQVDWCDAYAYCKWVGKRLCGRIGGGANASADYANSDRSQWFRVCSNGGRNAYPYGGTYRSAACNGFNGPNGCDHDTGVPSGTCTLTPVGSYAQCQGAAPFSSVFDLSGNVIEWEDSCAPSGEGGEDNCRIRGGSVFARSESDMRCDADYVNPRSSAGPALGFRCCYP
jgi:formylglycine-generating enzyme